MTAGAAPSTPLTRREARARAGSEGEQSAVRDDGADERERLRARVAALEAALSEASVPPTTSSPIAAIDLRDERVLQDIGIYRYHHPLENAVAYRDRLKDLQSRISETARSGNAALSADMFTMDGSLAKGRKMMADLGKLMLRAYNAEADNCVRSLRSGNIVTAKKRLERAVEAIQRLGGMMELRINPDFHALRLEELELTADYQMKVQEEREAAREERERLREQARAEKELREERERLDKERSHYVNALEAMRLAGNSASADDLSRRLAQIDEAIAQNDYRIANIRAGYVYVISNIGAFGPGVVKVGLTRRLEPRERVQELSSASVPFPYDTHAIFFSDDAVSLETELHHALAHRRVNLANDRKEFFFATPAEVRELLQDRVGGGLLEFSENPEALQYYQSVSGWPEGQGAVGPNGSPRVQHDLR